MSIGNHSTIRNSARSRSVAGIDSTHSAIRRRSSWKMRWRKFPRWILWQALISPKMELVAADTEALGNDHWRVRLVVQNTGWLPSYVSKRSLERKVVRGVMVDIVLPDGARLLAGKPREEIGQLEGKAYKHTGISFWPDYHVTDDRAKIEWVVQGRAGDRIALIATHERAGTVRTEVKLG